MENHAFDVSIDSIDWIDWIDWIGGVRRLVSLIETFEKSIYSKNWFVIIQKIFLIVKYVIIV